MKKYVTTLEELQEVKHYITKLAILALDTETTGLDPYLGNLLLIQVGDEHLQYVINVSKFTEKQLKFILDILEDKNVLKVIHGAKFEHKWIFNKYGVVIKNVWDTLGAEATLFHGKHMGRWLNLAAVTKKYLGGRVMDKRVRKKFIAKKVNATFTEQEISYAAYDIEVLIPIYRIQLHAAIHENMLDLVKLENSCTAVTAQMELNGLYLDKEEWLSLITVAQEQKESAYQELSQVIRDENIRVHGSTKKKQMAAEQGQLFVAKDEHIEQNINFASSTQMLETLEALLGYEVDSTDIKVLSKYKKKHAFIPALIKYRKAEKKLTTYGEEFLQHIHPITGLIHSDFNQFFVETGRFSGKSPNLMNIPKEACYRSPFKPKNQLTHSMIDADYSGCELRLLTELSQEPDWIMCMNSGYDMHSYIGASMYNMKYEDITSNHKILPEYEGLRTNAKAIIFGIIYGKGAKALGESLGIEKEKAKELLELFFSKYPNIKKKIKELVENGKKNNMASSPFDNRRNFIEYVVWWIDQSSWHYENEMKNFPFQGGNASMLKRAMVYMQAAFFEHPEWDAKLRCIVHDEVVTTQLIKYELEVKDAVRECMIRAGKYYIKSIPVEVDVKIGNCWLH